MRTLERLGKTDWAADVVVVMDESRSERSQERQEQTARGLLVQAVADGAGFVLFLEDDLDFNRHLRHNLERWHPLLEGDSDRYLVASLYNPGLYTTGWNRDRALCVAHPMGVFGSQAFLLSRRTVRHVLARWESVRGAQDIKISRLGGDVSAMFYHRPSLVQHVGARSTWGGNYHWARDYSGSWRAP